MFFLFLVCTFICYFPQYLLYLLFLPHFPFLLIFHNSLHINLFFIDLYISCFLYFLSYLLFFFPHFSRFLLFSFTFHHSLHTHHSSFASRSEVKHPPTSACQVKVCRGAPVWSFLISRRRLLVFVKRRDAGELERRKELETVSDLDLSTVSWKIATERRGKKASQPLL